MFISFIHIAMKGGKSTLKGKPEKQQLYLLEIKVCFCKNNFLMVLVAQVFAISPRVFKNNAQHYCGIIEDYVQSK